MKKTINWTEVGARVFEAFNERGWTYEILSDRSGISIPTCRKLISGQGVQLEALLAIGNALNLTPDFMLGYWERKMY